MYRFDKMYMDKELIGDNLYQIIDQFSGRKVTPVKFIQTLNKIQPFYDGNVGTCQILAVC